MIRTSIQRNSVIAALILMSLAAKASAQKVMLNLRTNRTHYAIGDSIRFHLSYKNASDRAIWLLPHTEIYPANVFEVKNVRTKKKGEWIRVPGEDSIAWEGYAEEVVRLQPGALVTRTLVAEIHSKLPNFFEDLRTGIFLVFPGSAIRLDSGGQYQVRARFRVSPNHPVHAFLPAGRQIWHGETESNPVVIQIQQ